MKFENFLDTLNQNCKEQFVGYESEVTDNLYRINYAISKALQLIEEKRQVTEIKNNDVYLVEGIDQDKLYSQNGIIRRAESYSKGFWETKDSTPGTKIKKNELKLKTDSDLTFTNTEDFTVNVEGYALIHVQCEKKGILGNIPKNTLNIIKTPLQGIGSGNNLFKFEGGSNFENDYEFRKRYLKYLSLYQGLTKDDIQNEIYKVSGVNAVQLEENDKEEEKVLDNGLVMPVKSFVAYVDGGDNIDIAKAIYKKHNTSITQLGDIEISIYSDIRNKSDIIKFNRAKYVKIYYKFEIIGEVNITDLDTITKKYLIESEIGSIISNYNLEKNIKLFTDEKKLISIITKFSTDNINFSQVLRLKTGEKIKEVERL